MKIDPYTNSNIQNSVVMFMLYVFGRIYLFWASLFQKIKIVSLSSNFVPKKVKICTKQRRGS